MYTSAKLLVIICLAIVTECKINSVAYYDDINITETEFTQSSSVSPNSPLILKSFWCPSNMRQLKFDSEAFQVCRPLPCLMASNISVINNSDVISFSDAAHNIYRCPGTQRFSPFMSSELCNLVRLASDRDFKINYTGGSLFEFKTKITYKLGEYYYYPDAGEAVVCREKLMSSDVSNDVVVGCSVFKVGLNETSSVYPGGSLYLTNANRVVRPGFYKIDSDQQKVDACLAIKPKIWRCKHLYDIYSEFFHLQPNLNLWTNDGVEIEYSVGEYLMATNNSFATVCVDSHVIEPRSEEANLMYAIVSVISAVFIFLTFIVHLFYRQLNYHAKALLCHIISLLVMYVTIAVRTLIDDIQSESWRLLLFGLQYISALSAFLWLNVLAFELWRAFSSQHGHHGVMSHESHMKLWFILKCLYAWGIPVVLWILTIGLSYSPTAAIIFKLTPGSVWFTNKVDVSIFFYVPIIIILLENLILFFLTMWSIRKASQGTRMVNRNANKNLLRVFLKLFIIMGICWFAEAISWILTYRTDEYVWYFTDLINALQGIAIFLVYVCKKSTWKVIKSRWRSYKSRKSKSTTHVTTINMINFTRTKSTDEAIRP